MDVKNKNEEISETKIFACFVVPPKLTNYAVLFGLVRIPTSMLLYHFQSVFVLEQIRCR